MANMQLYLILFTALNIFLFSNANYIGIPENATDLKRVLNQKLELKCQYQGMDDNGEFTGWYKDGEQINNDNKAHYLIENSEKESKLIITLNEIDQEVKEWSVQTNKSNEQKPTKCQFGRINIKPSPQRMKTDQETDKLDANLSSVRRINGKSITFKCILEPNQTTNSSRSGRTLWKYGTNDTTYGKLPPGVLNISENEIFIRQVNKTHRGYYLCKRNGVSFVALLRVKDPFAALWPFIGIVSTVIVLVIGILLFEKRQKAAKAAAAATDENIDNIDDPLIQSPNKSSDNENKKQTVKI